MKGCIASIINNLHCYLYGKLSRIFSTVDVEKRRRLRYFNIQIEESIDRTESQPTAMLLFCTNAILTTVKFELKAGRWSMVPLPSAGRKLGRYWSYLSTGRRALIAQTK